MGASLQFQKVGSWPLYSEIWQLAERHNSKELIESFYHETGNRQREWHWVYTDQCHTFSNKGYTLYSFWNGSSNREPEN